MQSHSSVVFLDVSENMNSDLWAKYHEISIEERNFITLQASGY